MSQTPFQKCNNDIFRYFPWILDCPECSTISSSTTTPICPECPGKILQNSSMLSPPIQRTHYSSFPLFQMHIVWMNVMTIKVKLDCFLFLNHMSYSGDLLQFVCVVRYKFTFYTFLKNYKANWCEASLWIKKSNLWNPWLYYPRGAIGKTKYIKSQFLKKSSLLPNRSGKTKCMVMISMKPST